MMIMIIKSIIYMLYVESFQFQDRLLQITGNVNLECTGHN